MKFNVTAHDKEGKERSLKVEAENWAAVEKGLSLKGFVNIMNVESVEIKISENAPVLPLGENEIDRQYVVKFGVACFLLVSIVEFVFQIITAMMSSGVSGFELLRYAVSVLIIGAAFYFLNNPGVALKIVPEAKQYNTRVLPALVIGAILVLNGVHSFFNSLVGLCINLSSGEKYSSSLGYHFRMLVFAALTSFTGFMVASNYLTLSKKLGFSVEDDKKNE